MARILIIAAFCFCGFSQAQNNPSSQTQKQSDESKRNPFEPISPVSAPPAGPGRIERIDFRGSRLVPQDTLRQAISSKMGDPYSEDAIRRDVMILKNTDSYRFDEVRVSTEEGRNGGVILHFVVTEKPSAN